MGQVHDLEVQQHRLRRSLRRWRLVALVSAAGLAVFLIRFGRLWVLEHSLDLGLAQINRSAPHAKDVRKLLRPTSYSGLPILYRPDFRISLDLDRQEWTVHNVHRFDAEGRVVLDEGRYGICGDLSASVYRPVRELFDPTYSIEFVRAAESQFFPASLSAHYVLRILRGLPPADPEVYILDPSFDRYGPLEDFEDYIFYEPREQLAFVKTRNPNETMPVGIGMPLIIHSKVLLGLAINRNGRKLDAENYRLSVVATLRYRYAGRNFLSVRRAGGRVEVIENRKLVSSVMPAGEYQRLRDRVLELFEGIRVTGGRGSVAP